NLLSTVTQVAAVSAITSINLLSAVSSINTLSTVTQSRSWHGNKVTYAITTSQLMGVTAPGGKQILQFWHSSASATRAQLGRVLVSISAGTTGTSRLQITRITSAPAGTS